MTGVARCWLSVATAREKRGPAGRIRTKKTQPAHTLKSAAATRYKTLLRWWVFGKVPVGREAVGLRFAGGSGPEGEGGLRQRAIIEIVKFAVYVSFRSVMATFIR
jgi:hypothetical protein